MIPQSSVKTFELNPASSRPCLQRHWNSEPTTLVPTIYRQTMPSQLPMKPPAGIKVSSGVGAQPIVIRSAQLNVTNGTFEDVAAAPVELRLISF
ncbi:hypothetical protein NPIL_276111 [Nephila pilipes]|uniref:Uncharacterized protein n=1 Tax=Nephila pilipes TaxID=299642 RepID=A0A8X6UU74_NEPPI|nr:hypothetical protein NPIL_276111 [Nephila pilipes]